jgi:hypothetical protein
MTVSVNGWHYADWRVSTARRGYWTPRGSFRPYLLKRMHYSRKYDNSPMPPEAPVIRTCGKGDCSPIALLSKRQLGRRKDGILCLAVEPQ